jgi:hypothetical protein
MECFQRWKARVEGGTIIGGESLLRSLGMLTNDVSVEQRVNAAVKYNTYHKKVKK